MIDGRLVVDGRAIAVKQEPAVIQAQWVFVQVDKAIRNTQGRRCVIGKLAEDLVSHSILLSIHTAGLGAVTSHKAIRRTRPHALLMPSRIQVMIGGTTIDSGGAGITSNRAEQANVRIATRAACHSKIERIGGTADGILGDVTVPRCGGGKSAIHPIGPGWNRWVGIRIAADVIAAITHRNVRWQVIVVISPVEHCP